MGRGNKHAKAAAPAEPPPPSFDDPIEDQLVKDGGFKASFHSTYTDITERTVDRETAYAECGTPYADLVAHAIKFACAIVLLAVQTFTVHRDMWPPKTMAVIRYSVIILLIPLCTDFCRDWANRPESALKWPALRFLRRALPFYTPLTVHSVLCGSSAARILAAFSRRRALAILWTMPAWWFVTDVWMDLSLMHQRDSEVAAAAAQADEEELLTAGAGVILTGTHLDQAAAALAAHSSGKGGGKGVARTYVGAGGKLKHGGGKGRDRDNRRSSIDELASAADTAAGLHPPERKESGGPGNLGGGGPHPPERKGSGGPGNLGGGGGGGGPHPPERKGSGGPGNLGRDRRMSQGSVAGPHPPSAKNSRESIKSERRHRTDISSYFNTGPVPLCASVTWRTYILDGPYPAALTLRTAAWRACLEAVLVAYMVGAVPVIAISDADLPFSHFVPRHCFALCAFTAAQALLGELVSSAACCTPKLRDARALLLSGAASDAAAAASAAAAGAAPPPPAAGPGVGRLLMRLLDWVAEEGGVVRVLDFVVGAELAISLLLFPPLLLSGWWSWQAYSGMIAVSHTILHVCLHLQERQPRQMAAALCQAELEGARSRGASTRAGSPTPGTTPGSSAPPSPSSSRLWGQAAGGSGLYRGGDADADAGGMSGGGGAYGGGAAIAPAGAGGGRAGVSRRASSGSVPGPNAAAAAATQQTTPTRRQYLRTQSAGSGGADGHADGSADSTPPPRPAGGSLTPGLRRTYVRTVSAGSADGKAQHHVEFDIAPEGAPGLRSGAGGAAAAAAAAVAAAAAREQAAAAAVAAAAAAEEEEQRAARKGAPEQHAAAAKGGKSSGKKAVAAAATEAAPEHHHQQQKSGKSGKR